MNANHVYQVHIMAKEIKLQMQILNVMIQYVVKMNMLIITNANHVILVENETKAIMQLVIIHNAKILYVKKIII
jgi:hypothetical protein